MNYAEQMLRVSGDLNWLIVTQCSQLTKCCSYSAEFWIFFTTKSHLLRPHELILIFFFKAFSIIKLRPPATIMESESKMI